MTSPPNDLDQFFQRHFPVIRGKCARMLGDSEEAADVAQETFLRLWRSPAASAPAAARASWIYLTATRLAVDRLRRTALGVELPESGGGDLDAITASGQGAEQVVAARQALRRLAARLDPRTLEVLVLLRFDCLGQEEVAEVTGLSSRQIRRLLVRAEAQMAAMADLQELAP